MQEYSTPSTPLELRIGERLTEAGYTLATAESCSGGLIAHRITNVAGSSAHFLGGVVAYSNGVKTRLLGVSEADIASHGAVSGEVARGMAEGVRARFGADFGIGVTGIAGPGGGSLEKPVGLVYVCVAGKAEATVARNEFAGTREEVKSQAAGKALQMLWELVSS